jgi:hypothetical protein
MYASIALRAGRLAQRKVIPMNEALTSDRLQHEAEYFRSLAVRRLVNSVDDRNAAAAREAQVVAGTIRFCAGEFPTVAAAVAAVIAECEAQR